jgi:hypothetical protein
MLNPNEMVFEQNPMSTAISATPVCNCALDASGGFAAREAVAPSVGNGVTPQGRGIFG